MNLWNFYVNTILSLTLVLCIVNTARFSSIRIEIKEDSTVHLYSRTLFVLEMWLELLLFYLLSRGNRTSEPAVCITVFSLIQISVLRSIWLWKFSLFSNMIKHSLITFPLLFTWFLGLRYQALFLASSIRTMMVILVFTLQVSQRRYFVEFYCM